MTRHVQPNLEFSLSLWRGQFLVTTKKYNEDGRTEGRTAQAKHHPFRNGLLLNVGKTSLRAISV